jgi:hypothetical protein
MRHRKGSTLGSKRGRMIAAGAAGAFTIASAILRRGAASKDGSLKNGSVGNEIRKLFNLTSARPILGPHLKKQTEYSSGALVSSTSGSNAEPPSKGVRGMLNQEVVGTIGSQIYHEMYAELVRTSLGKYICISVDTAEYVLGDTSSEAYSRFRERFGDAASWEARVGEAPYVFRGLFL